MKTSFESCRPLAYIAAIAWVALSASMASSAPPGAPDAVPVAAAAQAQRLAGGEPSIVVDMWAWLRRAS
jgi:hypothetical protein